MPEFSDSGPSGCRFDQCSAEGNRYLPGLRAWVGYRNAIVYYDRHDRVGGDGKLSFLSRIKYAMDAITSFSYKPLRFSFVLAGFAAVRIFGAGDLRPGLQPARSVLWYTA